MFTIIGSGFGMYGYLPALVELLGEKVVLPQSYELKIRKRPELRRSIQGIVWTKDQDAAVNAADALIIATPPQCQLEITNRYIRNHNISKFVLEKPVATTPKEGSDLLRKLDSAGKRYIVGYTLLHVIWQSKLEWPTSIYLPVDINWCFMAHHYKYGLHNWKRFHGQGGGVLRFFGIHVLAMLALRGYSEVLLSHIEGSKYGEYERWYAIFSGSSLPECRVNIDSRSPVTIFEIRQKGTALLSLSDPFASEHSNVVGDPRISVLARLIMELESDGESMKAIYEQTQNLWKKVEEITLFNTR